MCLYGTRTAIIRGAFSITYRELQKRADGVAAWLMKHGAIPGQTIVGVLLNDTIDLIIAILGILRCGCIFCPMDIKYPTKRIQKYLDHISCKMVIVDKNAVCTDLRGIDKIEIADVENYLCDECLRFDMSSYRLEDPIYIYFTSGTTQSPKAILGKNMGLVHFIQWEIKELKLDENVRISQLTPPCHDPFLRDIFVPLMTGGTICLPEKPAYSLSPLKLVQYLDTQKVNLVHITPSLFRVMAAQAVECRIGLENLNYICLAGESIYPSDLKLWFKTYSNRIKLMNLYGPTETTLAKLFYWIKPNDVYKSCIPVGKPIDDTTVAILDESLSVCVSGQIGELYIRTKYGTYGYINAPSLMQSAFVKNPLTHLTDEIVYKTGDLARYNSQKEIELIGRRDRQIKLNGFRIELDEIEGVIHEFPSIESVAVIAINKNTKTSLTAFYVVCAQPDDKLCNDKPDIQNQLRTYLLDRLPEYMCPVRFIRLETMPLTSNGKTDYAMLSALETTSTEEYTAERSKTEVEEKLSRIWCELLNRKLISIQDNFMHLGGNSLAIMQLVYQIYKEFHIDLPLGIVFERPTLGELASYIEQHIGSQTDSMCTKPDSIYKLSPAQARIYVSHMYEEGDTSYNLPAVMIIHGNLDINKLENCCKVLLEKHECLSSSFYIQGNDIFQKVQPVNFHIEQINLHPNELDEYIYRVFIHPFDLSNPPLFRITVAKLGKEHFALLFDIHHIVSDGLSQKLIIHDLIYLYLNKEVQSPEWSYHDYVDWLSGEEQLTLRQKNMQFWIEQFKVPSSKLTLPFDGNITQPSNAGSYVSKKIPFELYRALQETAKDCASTLFTVLLSAFFLLLRFIGGTEDITIGVPVHGRNHSNLKRVVGMFVQMLPIRIRTGGCKESREVIEILHQHMRNVYTHMNFDMDMLVSSLNNVNIYRPQIDTVFVMQDAEELTLADVGLDIQPYLLKKKSVRNKLVMEVIENKNTSLDIHLDYQLQYFSEKTADQLLKQYIDFLRRLFSHPDTQLSEF